MTITLERPVSPVCDSKLANDIRHLVDNLDTNIYNIVKDYQEIFRPKPLDSYLIYYDSWSFVCGNRRELRSVPIGCFGRDFNSKFEIDS